MGPHVWAHLRHFSVHMIYVVCHVVLCPDARAIFHAGKNPQNPEAPVQK